MGPIDRLDEAERLAAIRATGLTDEEADPALQRIARLVTHLLGTPVALATVVDHERQFFAAAEGFDVEPFASRRQTPLSHSFCQYVVLSGSPLVVPDAREEALLAGNRAIDEMGVIAYLGVPLKSPDGAVLGSLCAIDSKPRTWSAADETALRDLAALLTDELRLRAVLRGEARSDPLTGLANRRAWDERIEVELARAERHEAPLSLICLDLDRFKAVNDEQGHAAGDAILVELARRWRQPKLLRPTDLIARLGGDEFAVLLPGADMVSGRAVAARVIGAAGGLIGVSVGVACWDRAESPAALLQRADAELLNAKRRRRGDRAG